jgi:hypothetical protein
MLANNNNKIIHRYRRRDEVDRIGRIESERNVYEGLCHDGDDRDLQGSLMTCLRAATNRNPMTGLYEDKEAIPCPNKKGMYKHWRILPSTEGE